MNEGYKDQETEIGNITIRSFNIELRELLDKATEEYEKEYGEDSIYKITGYRGLYWFLRYSKCFKNFLIRIKEKV